MSDDWKVGDLAVCVDARENPKFPGSTNLVEGRAYKVVEVFITRPERHSLYGTCACGIEVAGIRSGAKMGFAAPRFRKILPDEPKACEEEFRILLQLSKKRAKEAVE